MNPNRGKMTTAMGLVQGVIDTTNAKLNGSIFSLQEQMETTSHWLDEAITSAKRKIVEGTGVSIQDVKKAKTTTFEEPAPEEPPLPLSPILDKENSPNVNAEEDQLDQPQKEPTIRIKPPPSVVKRKVNGMRVIDLRKELKSKGIAAKGNKANLQQRLLQAYTTVEKIMSPPPKPESKDNNRSCSNGSVAREDPPTEKSKTDEDIPDSESVEMIVFESSSNSNNEGNDAVEKVDNTNSTPQLEEVEEEIANEGKPTEQRESLEKSVQDVEMIDPSEQQDKKDGGGEACADAVMEAEPTKSRPSSSSSSILSTNGSNVIPTEEKRVSLMDCTEVGVNQVDPSDEKADPVVQKQSVVPKATTSLDAPISTDEKTAMETAAPIATGEKTAMETENQDSKERNGPSSCRKVTQDSVVEASLRSNQSDGSFNSSCTSENEVETSEPPQKPDTIKTFNQERMSQAEKQLTPMKMRVQAAIQMFTKSPAPAKPMPKTTPSKLSWLTNKSQSQAQIQFQSQPQQFQLQKQSSKPSALQPIPQETANEKNQVQLLQTEKLTATKAVRRPGMGPASTNNGSSSTSAVKSDKVMASNAARTARLAEIRGKSKPVSNATVAAFSASSTNASRCALKSKTCSVAEDQDGKQKQMRDQMREKAAARMLREAAAIKNTTNLTFDVAKKEDTKAKDDVKAKAANGISEVKNDVNVKATSTVSEVSEAPPAEAKQPIAKEAPKPPAEVPQPETPKKNEDDTLAALRPQLLSPMDTYEISDREDSDSEDESESDSEDEKQARKKIPEWAQRANLLPALEKQFAQGKGRCDPDEIFCEVQTCDLQAIFNNKRSRYLRRTSSGNWTKDKVTVHEKLTYKRAMGFNEKQK